MILQVAENPSSFPPWHCLVFWGGHVIPCHPILVRQKQPQKTSDSPRWDHSSRTPERLLGEGSGGTKAAWVMLKLKQGLRKIHSNCNLLNDYMGGFLKWWVSPTTMGFPTKNDHFGVFWGYHHLRKHPYISWYVCIWYVYIHRHHRINWDNCF